MTDLEFLVVFYNAFSMPSEYSDSLVKSNMAFLGPSEIWRAPLNYRDLFPSLPEIYRSQSSSD